MEVSFIFTEHLQTLFPGLETSVSFSGDAYVNGERVTIIRVEQVGGQKLKIPHGDDMTSIHEAQNLATGQMGVFLGVCRNAAQEEAHKLQKWLDDAIPKQAIYQNVGEYNAGFIPNPSDTSYMKDDEDISFPKI